jgi:hypothetical protein
MVCEAELVEVKCWRCVRTVQCVSPDARGFAVVTCKRCKARNVIDMAHRLAMR